MYDNTSVYTRSWGTRQGQPSESEELKALVFYILDYIETLTPTGEKDKFYCPVCSNDNLSINRKTGAYKCWNGCECAEIREVLSPRKGKVEASKVEASSNGHKKTVITPRRLTPKKQPIEVVRLGTSTQKPPYVTGKEAETVKKPRSVLASATSIRYTYSPTQFVYRYDWLKDDRPLKTVRPFYEENGEQKPGKGSDDWPAYNLAVLDDLKPGKFVLGVEGEKCVIAASELNLAAITWDGSSWTEESVSRTAQLFKEKGLGLIFLPDNDDTGVKKCEVVRRVFTNFGVPFLAVHLKDYVDEFPEKGDIADWMEMGRAKGLSEEDMILQLQSFIDQARKSHNQETQKIPEGRSPEVRPGRAQQPEPKETAQKSTKKTRLVGEEALDFFKEKYGERLKLNTLGKEIELDGEVIDVEFAYLRMIGDKSIHIPKVDAIDCCRVIAMENEYNPVREYLEKVSAEVEPIDISNLASRYLGNNDPLANSCLRKWLISGVARAYWEGCKADAVYTLKGDQGIGKSSFFATLGGKWFSDDLIDVGNKDSLQILDANWILELAEVETVVGRKESGVLKNFISKPIDKFREPYARKTRNYPRHSVFGASVNDDAFLKDETGNRRFWITEVRVSEIDIELLKKERDAIWSAAVKAYKEGVAAGTKYLWWLTPEEEKANAENNRNYDSQDPWENLIIEYIKDRTLFHLEDLLVDALEIDTSKSDPNRMHRVARILKREGWKSDRRTINGAKHRVWVKEKAS